MVDLIIAVFISQGGGVLDPSLDHQAKEEFINSARRGHEDDGGEGSVSERKGDTPEGWRFLPSPFGLGSHFLWKVKVESES